MTRAGRLERQRERVRELLRADATRSNRSIAAELGCSHVTVGRVRGQLAGQDVHRDEPDRRAAANHRGSENLIEPAGPGNDRATKHGAYSEARVAPIREHFLEEL